MALGSTDERHLLRTIELAASARTAGNHPFGSLIVDAAGKIVREAENTVVTSCDVTGHAELNVVRAAGIELGDAFLLGATLYTSTEPCAMCAGAIYWAGITRVVYALGSDMLEQLVKDLPDDSTLRLPCREVFARGGRRVDVSGPHLLEQAAAVHAGFWA
jgi:tRNA(Arg) A34 adenosine deaminase TadA